METLFRHDEIGMIINPNAKRVKKSIVKARFFWRDFLDESKAEVTRDVPAIMPALERLKSQNIRVLGIYGGDGTMQRTLTAALNVWTPETLPAILALKGGTANALVKNMGIRKKARSYMRRFWKSITQEKLEKVELFEVPLLRVEDSSTDEVKYGFIFTNGLAYKSVEQYQTAEQPGLWDTFRSGIYPIIAYFLGLKSAREYFQRPEMTVDMKGLDSEYHYTGPVTVILCSTLKRLILWYAPFTGSISDTNGYYCVINHLELDDLFSNFLSLARGVITPEGHVNTVALSTRICADLGYMFDGELFRRSEPYELKITRGPSIKLVVLPVL